MLAATVVVLRHSAGGPEVLLVRRHERGTFGGASVFPGGMVDPGDDDPALASPESRFDSNRASQALGGRFDASVLRSLHVAACRELFEEAGLLLARDRTGLPADPRGIAEARNRLNTTSAGGAFSDLLRSAGLVLALDALIPLAHWITPENQPRRWNTLFFLAEAPEGQAARSDGTETSEAHWLTPAAALDAYRAGEHVLAPPTFRVLEDLVRFDDVRVALAATRAAGPPTTILPVALLDPSGPILAYPGDRDYPGSSSTGFNRLTLHEGRWRSIR